MAGWPKLNPAGQKEVLDRLTVTLLEALPEDWQRLVIEYRVVGRHSDGRVALARQDGVLRDWDPPVEVWHRLQELRGGMYAEGEGTWFGAQYRLERPDQFKIQYNWQTEPDFVDAPAPDEFELGDRPARMKTAR
jgi:hypothetical protein